MHWVAPSEKNNGNGNGTLEKRLWDQKSSARSQVKLTIEDILDEGLPRAYSPELYQQKCSAVFEHLYEAYPEVDGSIYATGV